MPIKNIRNIIIGEGFLIATLGSIIGISLGILICFLQQHYGLLKLGGKGATFVVDSYPIVIQTGDVIITFMVAIIIGILASLYPAKTALKINNIREE